jgi:hypothetical protein
MKLISKGYEKSLFEAPCPDRFAFERSAAGDAPVKRVYTFEQELVWDLRDLAVAVKAVVDHKGVVFNTVQGPRNELGIERTRLGENLLKALGHVSEADVRPCFPCHGYNPYVELAFEALRQSPHMDYWIIHWKLVRGAEALRNTAELNLFVETLRRKAEDPDFKRAMERVRRNCDKNCTELKSYIRAIYRCRGTRHLVVRIDLSYERVGARNAYLHTSVTLKEVKQHIAKFRRYVNDKFKATGFVAKLEYGFLKGYHFHVLVFLNGHRHQQDVLIGKQMGEHWSASITEGRGLSFNCNAVAARYRKLGIGMINYDDGDKRTNLMEKVVPYLTKTDFWLRFQPGGKTFFKGLMPRPPLKTGRPRKHISL